VLSTVRAQLPARQDAFYVVDLSEVAHKYDEWVSQLPGVRPFYAVKCNDDPEIVATLAALGAGFDCASKGEMSMVLAQGVAPRDIIFAHPAKQVSHILYAKEKGVARMTFDNEDELEKVAAHYPAAELVLRILADDTHSVCRLGLKFGAPLSAVAPLLKRAAALGLNVVGVSYHVGSGNGNAASFADAVRDARAAFDIAAGLGMKLTLLDIGGGFPGSALGEDFDASAPAAAAPAASAPAAADPYAGHPNFRAIARHVRGALDAHFPPGCGVTVIGEPGRFFVKSSHALAVSVVGKRRTADEAGSGGARFNYFVNDGLYGSFNCLVYDHATAEPARLFSPARGEERDLAPAALAAAEAAEDAALAAPADALAVLAADGTVRFHATLGEPHALALAAAAEAARGVSQRLLLRDAEADAPRLKLRVGGGRSRDEDGFSAGGGGGGSGGYGPLKNMHARQMATAAMSAPAPAAPAPSELPAPVRRRHALHPTTLWGPTCDSFDKISDKARLPELVPGDWLMYENMGAYTVAGSCKFNGMPIATKVYIKPCGGIKELPEEEHA